MRDYGDPLPPNVRKLDLIAFFSRIPTDGEPAFVYHDTLNRCELFAAVTRRSSRFRIAGSALMPGLPRSVHAF